MGNLYPGWICREGEAGVGFCLAGCSRHSLWHCGSSVLAMAMAEACGEASCREEVDVRKQSLKTEGQQAPRPLPALPVGVLPGLYSKSAGECLDQNLVYMTPVSVRPIMSLCFWFYSLAMSRCQNLAGSWLPKSKSCK